MKAWSTVFVASAAACAWDLQFGLDEGDEEGEPVGEAVALGDAVVVPAGLAAVLGLINAEPDGLGDAWVIVIVVTRSGPWPSPGRRSSR